MLTCKKIDFLYFSYLVCLTQLNIIFLFFDFDSETQIRVELTANVANGLALVLEHHGKRDDA